MANKRAYKQTSTTSLVNISGFDTGTVFDRISVVNLTDGDVEVYLSADTSTPILIVASNLKLAFDEFRFRGQIAIKNSTGTGGAVYIHVWQGGVG